MVDTSGVSASCISRERAITQIDNHVDEPDVDLILKSPNLWLKKLTLTGMASLATTRSPFDVQSEGDSDYGSDFSSEGEEIIGRLLAEQERIGVIEDDSVITELEFHHIAQNTRVPRVIGRGQVSNAFLAESDIAEHNRLPIKVVYAEHQGVTRPLTEQGTVLRATRSNVILDEKEDTRSPIEQFRTAPKKPLSVTDLVSPAWCELQYWYALKIRGKPKRTKAMQEGSVVHKELEDQVYTTVKVEIATKEDGWALRIWNVIQGLRTLQEIGYTRELEVWGTIDGLVVIGVIDEVSFTCPDPELEHQLINGEVPAKDGPPANQTTISQFYKTYNDVSPADSLSSKQRDLAKKIYISDVKTRSGLRLPTGAAFRPTKMQLMTYHHLLSSLVANQVDPRILFDRLGLDGDKQLSDSFIAKVGSLNQGIPINSSPCTEATTDLPASQDSVTILLEHNSLRQLWSFMVETYQSILPAGKDSIGNVLRAEYRSRDNGEVLGSKTLAMDENMLKTYLDHEMKWWKGEREPLGVVIEEAYKCKNCDYAEICDWRRVRIVEATERARATKKAIVDVKKWEV